MAIVKHKPTVLDIKTDLQRCVMASFGPKEFEDENFKMFLNHALRNLDLIKNRFSGDRFRQIMIRIEKATDAQNPVHKRREDLLTAAVLI